MTVEPPRDPEATPDDVAALLTARTKDAAGRELGTWTDATRPTAAQVQVRIEIARALVHGIGVIPDHCREISEAVVALKAAMLTEAAFWPEQTASNQSTFERLRQLYDEAWASLQICAGVGPEGGGGGAYDLDTSGERSVCWPFDWWQRDLENELALADALASERGCG